MPAQESEKFIFVLFFCTFSDRNECIENPGICNPGQCIDTLGSYRCICPNGFKVTRDQSMCVGKTLSFAPLVPDLDAALIRNGNHAPWFQTWTSVKSSRVATGPARTRWAPTTVCATPDFRTRTTATALVRAPVIVGVKVGTLHVALCICVLVRCGRVCCSEGLVSKRAVCEHHRQLPLRVQRRLRAHPRRTSVCR